MDLSQLVQSVAASRARYDAVVAGFEQPVMSEEPPRRPLSPFLEHVRLECGLIHDDMELDEEAAARGQRVAWFGTLAFLLGFLELGQVDQVVEEQASTTVRFGEMAVALGLMTEEQVETVLRAQSGSITFADLTVAVRLVERTAVGDLILSYVA